MFEAFQHVDRLLQVIRIQGSESLVDEERLDRDVLARQIRQAQRHRQAGEKFFTTRKTGDRTYRTCLIQILNLQTKALLLIDLDLVARSEFPQMPVGLPHQSAQRKGLGEGAEFFAIGRADQLPELSPIFQCFFLLFPMLFFLPGHSFVLIVGGQ